ncbi:MAG: STAS domain-containing protein [Betaproteobacteria bacterium]|nr:STAS domain-containing protein [Betaproteobacteria bacterium]
MGDARIQLGQFVIEGELTIYRVTELQQTLLDLLRRCDAVDADLSQVNEIDGAGLQWMVAAKREANRQHKPLRFAGHSRPVQEALDLCDLGAFFGDQVVISSQAWEGAGS